MLYYCHLISALFTHLKTKLWTRCVLRVSVYSITSHPLGYIRNARLHCSIFLLNENKCPACPHITTNHNLLSLVSRICIFLLFFSLSRYYYYCYCYYYYSIVILSFLHHATQKACENLKINLLDGM